MNNDYNSRFFRTRAIPTLIIGFAVLIIYVILGLILNIKPL